MLLIATNKKIMGTLALSWGMTAAGVLSTVVMAAASVAFLVL
jgi:Mn2+/Fe2+ NRAMP family transporter